MTSSLVGSEMCIRDRVRALTTSSQDGKLFSLVADGDESTILLSTPTHPVSYTHLTLPTICSV
eukprot:10557841-Prorocentrum_lima.AAC.1